MPRAQRNSASACRGCFPSRWGPTLPACSERAVPEAAEVYIQNIKLFSPQTHLLLFGVQLSKERSELTFTSIYSSVRFAGGKLPLFLSSSREKWGSERYSSLPRVTELFPPPTLLFPSLYTFPKASSTSHWVFHRHSWESCTRTEVPWSFSLQEN